MAAIRDGGGVEGLGHRVDEAAPEVDGLALAQSYFTMYFGQVAAEVRKAERVMGAGARGKTELVTQLLAQIGESLSAGVYVEHLLRWNSYARAVGRFRRATICCSRRRSRRSRRRSGRSSRRPPSRWRCVRP